MIRSFRVPPLPHHLSGPTHSHAHDAPTHTAGSRAVASMGRTGRPSPLLLVALGALLLPSHGFLPSSRCGQRPGQPLLGGPKVGGSSKTALGMGWLQDLFGGNSASSASSTASTSSGSRAPKASDEEEAKRKRHFRRYEPRVREEDEGPGAPYKYALGANAALPSMDDLWREAWPTDACKDIMERREQVNSGTGPPQPDALTRSFGHNDTITIIFYKDSSSWCPYCHTVWMALEELRIPYKIKRVNLLAYGEKPEWVYGVSSTGLLPVLEVDGRIVRESLDIIQLAHYYANSRYPQTARSMYPPKDDPLHAAAEALLALERELYKWWFVWVFEPPEAKGREEFLAALGQVEEALARHADGPWFLPGAEPSLVDCVFAPKLERMVASVLYWKGLQVRGAAPYPNLTRWLEALDKRPSYAAFKSDHYTLVNSLEPLFGRAFAVDTPEAREIRARIDGAHPQAWRLPLRFDGTDPADDLEPLAPGSAPSEAYARQGAAVKLIINHKRVPRYMLRALGRPGPEYRAALSDPYAEPDEAHAAEVDAAYRYLVLALLRGHEAVAPMLRVDLAAADGAYGGKDAGVARARIVACLDYLKERIGVPRDMTLPEARQLRAHLNWLADELK